MISKKKKKKRSSPKFGEIFLPISQVQTFEGGLFSDGGIFSIFHRKSASKAQKTCDFAYFTSQWRGLEPPPPPPGYATGYRVMFFDLNIPNFKSKNLVLASPLKQNLNKIKNWLGAPELVMAPRTYARHNQFTTCQNCMVN